MKTLKQYLRNYLKWQDNIILLSRLSNSTWWGDRCLYLEPEKYEPTKHYNHRIILMNEIVIEFDSEDKKQNRDLIERVINKIKNDGIRYMLWCSGNKSYHLHFLVDTKGAKHLPTLKKTIVNHYTKDLPIRPDFRLCSENHLVRAEFGLHEKSGRYKTLIKKSPNYFQLNKLPSSVWNEYVIRSTFRIKRKVNTDINKLSDCTCLKYILDTTQFKSADDGRERALFMLIHLLKEKYTKEELKRYLCDWYKYSGGFKLSEHKINCKIDYHWNRDYSFGKEYISELLEDIDKKDVLDSCPIHGEVK